MYANTCCLSQSQSLHSLCLLYSDEMKTDGNLQIATAAAVFTYSLALLPSGVYFLSSVVSGPF